MYKILLVDDEKLELETLRDHIDWNGMGITVAATAKNGRDALRLTGELKPDIVLTDVKMPLMDGLEYARKAKSLDKNLKIAFLSGYDEFSFVKTAIEVDASGYLLKPVNVDELGALMRKITDKLGEEKTSEQSVSALVEKYFKDLFAEKDLYNALVIFDNDGTLKPIDDFYEFVTNKMLPLGIVHSGSYYLLDTIYENFLSHDPGLSSAICSKEELWSNITGYGSISEIKNYVISVLNSITGYFREKNKDSNLQVVNKIISILEASYSKQLTVEDISREIYLSPNYIRTIFKEKTKETILEYITKIRMKKASELLNDKSIKVHEVSALIGYENVSYFCSVFQKFYGITPNEFRKKLL